MPPLVLVAIAWIAGLIAARHWLVPLGIAPSSLLVLSLVPLAAILLWRQDRAVRLAGACALALLLAALRYQAALPDLNDPAFLAYHNDSGWITLKGTVQGYPDERDVRTGLTVEADSIEIGGQSRPVSGKVLVRVPRFPRFQYGDRLQVSGLLETPPQFDDFSYQDYLARKSIYALIDHPQITKLDSGQSNPFWAAIFAVKDRTRDAVAHLVHDPEASLLQGILLGIRSGIPKDLYDDYNATGTSHIIIISGSNITFVATLFALTFGLVLGKRRAYWLTIVGISLYVLLVGADAAVVRAGLMGGLFVTAIYLGRRSTAYVSLLASAFVLTLINPQALWDVGFQLSFAATLGLILFAPPLERLFERGLGQLVSPDRARAGVRFLNQALIVTLAAQILTIPLVVYHFGRLSLVAPLANLLILPVQAPIMGLGGAAAILGLVPFLEPLARAIAWVPWLCLAYTNAVVRWLARWPFASLEIHPSSIGWLAIAYLAFVIALWAWSQRRASVQRAWTALTSRRSSIIILGVPLAIATLAWLALAQLPDGKLHVAFLDVGQGDAALITTPRGQQILVDGGPSPAALTSALGREMPFWDRSIDLLVMTHPDGDHITGLAEVLNHYDVGGWMDNGCPSDDALYAQCLAEMEEGKVTQRVIRAGDRLALDSGIILEVLHPSDEPVASADSGDNNNSVVLRLVWGEAGFLLTGDIEAEAEHLLVESGQPLPSDVLKVSHHGSGGSSTPEFLAAVAPSYAIISVGAGNDYGHPQDAVLERLAQMGSVKVLRTDEQGTIEFVTDGNRLWVQTER